MLDAEIQGILAELEALRGPAPVPVEQARAGHAAETARLAGEGPAVEHVEDAVVAGVGVRRYRPAGARGTIAYFHGGGWVVGTLDSVDAVCRALAVASGAEVVSVDYRLAPEHPFPAPVEDALAVVRELRPDVVAGDSAGANLAAVAANRLRDAVGIRLQLLVYPVTAAEHGAPSFTTYAEGYGLTADGMRHYWDLYLGGADGLDPDASPLREPDLAGVAPAHVLLAEFDVLHDEGADYAAALERAGVPATLVTVPGTIHGFWRWQGASALARAAVADAGAVVRAALAS